MKKKALNAVILTAIRALKTVLIITIPIWVPSGVVLITNFHDNVIVRGMSFPAFLRDLPYYSYMPVFEWYENSFTEVMALWYRAK